MTTLQKVLAQTVSYGRMVKFSHTVFALPFALSAAVLAQRVTPLKAADLFWVFVAMVAARSAAMGFNRIVDAEIDARNPRTAKREIPAGVISKAAATAFALASAAVFVVAAGMLGKLCLYLSVPVLAFLCLYSYTKRCTWLSHLYLGLAISLAPLGAWIALTQSFSAKILPLCLALLTYITGFDILYACQDAGFDRREGLNSIPVRFGVQRALIIAAGLHVVSFLSFLTIYPLFDMTVVYLMALAMIGVLFVIEHRLVNPRDLSRVNVAFFHINSVISVTLFVGILGDEIYRRWM